MQRFLLLVSFVVALLFALTTTALFAGQAPGKDRDHQIKQPELAKYSSLAKALKATQTPLDKTKVGKSKNPKIKSATHKAKHKKVASYKPKSSKKASYKKRGTSKSHSYNKARSMKKPANTKKKTAKNI